MVLYFNLSKFEGFYVISDRVDKAILGKLEKEAYIIEFIDILEFWSSFVHNFCASRSKI